MRLFFKSIELSVARENVAQLRAKLPDNAALLKVFDSAEKGRQKRPVLLGHAGDMDWKAQGFAEKVVVTCSPTSKMSMTRGQVVALGVGLALPPTVKFRPVVDRYSDQSVQGLIDDNIEAGELWDKGLE